MNTHNKKVLGMTMGFFIASAGIRHIFEGKVVWFATILSSLIFGGIIYWALKLKKTKEQ